MNVRADVNYLQNIRQLFIIGAMAWGYYDKKYPLLHYKFRKMDGGSWYMFSIPVKNLVDVYKSYYGRLPGCFFDCGAAVVFWGGWLYRCMERKKLRRSL